MTISAEMIRELSLDTELVIDREKVEAAICHSSVEGEVEAWFRSLDRSFRAEPAMVSVTATKREMIAQGKTEDEAEAFFRDAVTAIGDGLAEKARWESSLVVCDYCGTAMDRGLCPNTTDWSARAAREAAA